MDDDFKSVCNKRKRKKEKSSGARVLEPYLTGVRCPICQIPILNKKGFIHSATSCEGAREDAVECPEGLSCREIYLEHFRRFSHFNLALFRSREESERMKEDCNPLNVSGAELCDHEEHCKKNIITDFGIPVNSLTHDESKLIDNCSYPDVSEGVNYSGKQNNSDKKSSLKSGLNKVWANIISHVIISEEIVTSKNMTVMYGTWNVYCDICNKDENGKLCTFSPNIKVKCSSNVEDKGILCTLQQHPIELNIVYNQEGLKKISIDFICDFEMRDFHITIGNCCHFIELKCVIGKKKQLLKNLQKRPKTLACFDLTSLGLNEYLSAESTLLEKIWINLNRTNTNMKNEYVNNTTSFQDTPRNDIKEKWKNIFKKNSISDSPALAARSSSFGEKLKTQRKKCPFYKRIPETSFAVDAFQYGIIPGVSHYFLTHFHSDHYCGLSKKFKQRIICSPITAALVVKKLYVEPEYILIVKESETFFIGSVKITPLNANHCPGSLMFLFQLITGNCYLHVGDFRANSKMEEHPAFSSINVDILYLDTTYCNPRYEFPTQEEIIAGIVSISSKQLKSEPATLIVSGTYTIGKEKVFTGIANAINSNIWAPKAKREVLKCINDENLTSRLVDNPCQAQVHVWPIGKLNHTELEQHLRDCNNFFKRILAFNPSGWNCQRQCALENIPAVTRGNVTILNVPYSEHSSYSELRKFVKFLRPEKVIPTVGSRDHSFTAITQYCNKWLTKSEEKKAPDGQQKLTAFFTSNHS